MQITVINFKYNLPSPYTPSLHERTFVLTIKLDCLYVLIGISIFIKKNNNYTDTYILYIYTQKILISDRIRS